MIKARFKNREKVFLMSLGCPKNQVDSEIMSASILQEGFSFVPDPSEADVILVNSCSFMEEAVEESLTILESLTSYRREGGCRCLVLAGCMVERYGNVLIRELPDTDLFVGMRAEKAMGSILDRYLKGQSERVLYLRPPAGTRKTTHRLAESRTPLDTWVYVKIAEGCSNHCSYCTLPDIRGPLKSRPPGEILREVENLARKGAEEIILVAQDVAAYGLDRRRGKTDPLARLLRKLDKIEEVRWIRLLYCHPAHVNDEIIGLMGEMEKICPYLDLPIQHVSGPVLKAMKRPYNENLLRKQVEKLRAARPDIALRTTAMVGFPGETKKDFNHLFHFLEDIRFHHLGVFCYSPEKGTEAAARKQTVSTGEKQKRFETLMELQAGISEEIQKQFVGTVQEVLVEGVHPDNPDWLKARTRYQAPEVDGTVILKKTDCNRAGIVSARIVEAQIYDLVGEIVPNSLCL